MKKLIIAAAIVCAAVVSQAASVHWNVYTFDDIADPSGTGYYTGLATLSCAELGWSQSVSVVNGAFDTYFDFDADKEASYDFALTATTPTHTYSASGFGTTDASGNGEVGFDPGTWTAVPEPTSGLLLLLGVAGLALKRKRA